jgi:large subunit ribosomal protein L24
MRIKKGDKVKVIAGANRGNVGEVTKVLAKVGKVVVAGVNVQSKHRKPSQANPEGAIITREGPIDASNVALYDAKSKAVSKIAYKLEGEKKIRIAKKSKAKLDK